MSCVPVTRSCLHTEKLYTINLPSALGLRADDTIAQNLEADLDGDETQIIPDLLAKLLYALTYNRQITSVSPFLLTSEDVRTILSD